MDYISEICLVISHFKTHPNIKLVISKKNTTLSFPLKKFPFWCFHIPKVAHRSLYIVPLNYKMSLYI